MLGIFVQKQHPARRVTIDAPDSAAIEASFDSILLMYFPGEGRSAWRRATAAERAAPSRRKTKLGRDKDAV